MATTAWKGYQRYTRQANNAPIRSAPTTVTTTTPAAPFLTAQQQQTKDADYGTYQQNLNTWNQSIADNTTLEGQNEAKQQYNTKVASAQADALAAARGIMGSGIQMGDLADINTTLATNLLTLRTNLASTVSGIRKQMTDASTAWNQEVHDYNNMAAENAQNTPPITTTQRVQPAQSAHASPAASTNGVVPLPTHPKPPTSGVVKMPSNPPARAVLSRPTAQTNRSAARAQLGPVHALGSPSRTGPVRLGGW